MSDMLILDIFLVKYFCKLNLFIFLQKLFNQFPKKNQLNRNSRPCCFLHTTGRMRNIL